MSTSLKVKKSSAQAVQDFINYIKARKDGTIKSLRSKYTKLDSYLMGRKSALTSLIAGNSLSHTDYNVA
jgi:hypothetical protein